MVWVGLGSVSGWDCARARDFPTGRVLPRTPKLLEPWIKNTDRKASNSKRPALLLGSFHIGVELAHQLVLELHLLLELGRLLGIPLSACRQKVETASILYPQRDVPRRPASNIKPNNYNSYSTKSVFLLQAILVSIQQ